MDDPSAQRLTPDTIRVFVGCAANHEDAESQAVLEYTLRKHASQPVDIVWMKQSNDPDSFWYGWNTTKWATPFSGFRWGIPAYCNYEGRAIYMDSDVIVMDDIAQLWNAELLPGKCVIAKGGGSWRFCVSLWDCRKTADLAFPIERIRSDPDAHKKLGLLWRNSALVQPFRPDQNWNCLDGESLMLDDPRLKALHYTAMANQPHLPWALVRLERVGRKHWFEGKVEPHWRDDLRHLFQRLMLEADQAGYRVEDYCADPIFGPYRKASTVNYKAGPRST